MDSDPIESSPARPNPQVNYHFGEGDTIATQPLAAPFVAQSRTPTNGYITQPTQPMRTPPKQVDQLSQIQVPASSSPPRQPTMYRPPTTQQRPMAPMYRPQQPQMYNPMMAPPGTTFRPPFYPQPHQYNNASSQSQSQSQAQATQFSDFGEDNQVSESDDELHQADIPSSFRKGKSLGVQDNFRHNISGFSYNPMNPNAQRPAGMAPQKRPASDSLSAYANVSRPPKQQRTMPPTQYRPANAMASTPQRKKINSIADIPDFGMQKKAQMIQMIMSHCSADDIYSALVLKRGNVDDAMDVLVNGNIRQLTGQSVDLTGEEDADGSTDEDVEITKVSKPTANRNFEAQRAGIGAYSRLQQKPAPPPQSSMTDQFSSPPRKPLSRLKVGTRPDRSRSSSAQPTAPRKVVRKVVDDDEESEAEESDVEPPPPVIQRESAEGTILKFLNEATKRQLVSMIDCKPEDAEFLISKQPFKSLDQARRVARPLVAGKKKGGNQKALGDRLVGQLIDTEESFQAVDRVVERCQSYLEDVQNKMKSLGIDVSRAVKDDGLAIASFEDAESPRVDSGTGTPMPPATNRIEQPKNMSKDRSLKDYQLVGLNWLNVMYGLRKKWAKQNGCILADEMGLGKTYQVISFISHLVEAGDPGMHLITVPSSTLENWLREFKMFSPDLHVEPYYGKQDQRREQQDQIEGESDSIKVIVTTYQIAANEKDSAWLRKFRFSSVIFDEGHMLKNSKSKRYKVLNRLRAQFRLFLTGTPLQNNLQELISVLAFIMPTLFEDAEDDLQMIFDCKAKTNDSDHAALLAAQRTNRAKEMLKPFILRRTKDQVLKDLPAKTNRIVYCDMTPKQQEVYDEYTAIHEQAMRDRLAGVSADDSGNKFPHLQDRRAAATHPLLRRTIYLNEDIKKHIVPKLDRKTRPFSQWSDQTAFENLTWMSDWEIHEICEKMKIKKPGPLKNQEWMDSGKVAKLIELLREHKAAGSRTLIFSQYAKVLDILGRVLETEDVTHVRLDGTTPTEDRLALIDKFNEDPSIQAFMITTRSGGAGINLATADKVIIVDPSFNPQDDVQAANRAHRIGQTKPVEVVTLVTKNTIEEQIYKLGLSKLKLDQQVAGGDEGEDDGGKASAKVEAKNMKRIEEMLMKGQTTPQDDQSEVDTPMASGDEKEKKKVGGSGLKTEVKAEDVTEEKKDIKDAYQDALEATGLELAKDE